VLTTVKCAVVRLRALMAQQSARLITNRPIHIRPGKLAIIDFFKCMIISTLSELSYGTNNFYLSQEI
jgi:hypothetical protein